MDLVAETISLQSKGTMAGFNDPLKNIKNKNTAFKRPHSYEVFETVKNDSLISQLDDKNDLLEYGDINFDVE